MLKKIRLFYWKQRDQGKGRQVKLFAFLLCLAMISVVGLIGNFIISSRYRNKDVSVKNGTSSSTSTGAYITSKGAVSGDGEEGQLTHEDTPEVTQKERDVDTSRLDSFLGFMSDNAYEKLEQCLVAEGQLRQCSSVKKLNYQQTTEGSYDVTSFVLFSDGSVYQCEYNLKSEALSVNQTEYSEADIQTLHDKQELAEKEAIKKQQQAEKKKAAAAKKKEKKSKKKAKSKKAKAKKKSTRKK